MIRPALRNEEEEEAAEPAAGEGLATGPAVLEAHDTLTLDRSPGLTRNECEKSCRSASLTTTAWSPGSTGIEAPRASIGMGEESSKHAGSSRKRHRGSNHEAGDVGSERFHAFASFRFPLAVVETSREIEQLLVVHVGGGKPSTALLGHGQAQQSTERRIRFVARLEPSCGSLEVTAACELDRIAKQLICRSF